MHRTRTVDGNVELDRRTARDPIELRLIDHRAVRDDRLIPIAERVSMLDNLKKVLPHEALRAERHESSRAQLAGVGQQLLGKFQRNSRSTYLPNAADLALQVAVGSQLQRDAIERPSQARRRCQPPEAGTGVATFGSHHRHDSELPPLLEAATYRQRSPPRAA